MPQGAPALLTQEWQSISRYDLESASNEESSGILRQACQDVFICLHPGESSTSLPGRTDGFQERAHHGRCVFLSIYVLLNLFLSSTWDWTLAEKWLADKKEEEKVSFQCVCSGNPPAASSTIPPWKNTGKLFSVFGPLYGVWMLKLFIIISQVYVSSECTLERQSLSWLHINTKHSFLMIVHQGYTPPNKLHNYWYINCILIFNDPITPLHVEQKQLLYLEMLSVRGEMYVRLHPVHLSPSE